ncbi:hypothetical protein BGY98DRAFT_930718 [Russula aff. rugulosa BPL654]|nr:hypothetical protein BGY98DRAFT_930718 [Russula aff. rugulosa BPL654]
MHVMGWQASSALQRFEAASPYAMTSLIVPNVHTFVVGIKTFIWIEQLLARSRLSAQHDFMVKLRRSPFDLKETYRKHHLAPRGYHGTTRKKVNTEEDGKPEAVENNLSYIAKQPNKERRAAGRLGSQDQTSNGLGITTLDKYDNKHKEMDRVHRGTGRARSAGLEEILMIYPESSVPTGTLTGSTRYESGYGVGGGGPSDLQTTQGEWTCFPRAIGIGLPVGYVPVPISGKLSDNTVPRRRKFHAYNLPGLYDLSCESKLDGHLVTPHQLGHIPARMPIKMQYPSPSALNKSS